MKIRKGFVSNSSSSSYIIAYDKNSVMVDPASIVDFIDNHLREPILFMSGLCDGYDAFELDMHQKNYLLKHKKRFIKYNKGTTNEVDYNEFDDEGNYLCKEVPYVTAITKLYNFSRDPNQYFMAEVDMSDIPEVEVTFEEIISVHNKTASPEVEARVKANEEREAIKIERERKAFKQTKLDYINSIKKSVLEKNDVNPDNLIVDYIEVDYASCDPDGSYDSYFAQRYFGLNEDTYFESLGDPDIDEAEDD